MELMLRHATGAGGSNSRDDDVGSGRTGRVRVLFTLRTSSFWTWTRQEEDSRKREGRERREGREGREGKAELSF